MTLIDNDTTLRPPTGEAGDVVVHSDNTLVKPGLLYSIFKNLHHDLKNSNIEPTSIRPNKCFGW